MMSFYDYVDLLDITDSEVESIHNQSKEEYEQEWRSYISEYSDEYAPESYEKRGAMRFE